ncbi:MAG: hypothetical protein H6620_12585, partial [Halobacteriovoraceae bacterium]|nr:hypothetical protein [Halobacteriovoraceae bacterium]
NWSDIAYNYLFYPEFSDYNDLPYSNSFQEARSLNIVGAHNSANFEYQQATPAASELREDTYEEAQKYVTCYRYLSNGEREEISTQEYFEEYDPKAISENLRSYSIAIANESEGADQDELAEESMNHLAKMICDIANNQGLNIKYIDTHHNTKGKPCPGKNMREQLAKSIEKKVRICALNKNIKFLERGVEYPDEDHLH